MGHDKADADHMIILQKLTRGGPGVGRSDHIKITTRG